MVMGHDDTAKDINTAASGQRQRGMQPEADFVFCLAWGKRRENAMAGEEAKLT